MVRCVNCGNDNLDCSEFCDECGVKLPSSTPAQAQSDQAGEESKAVEGEWEQASIPLPSFKNVGSQAKPVVPYPPPANISAKSPNSTRAELAAPSVEPARKDEGKRGKAHAKLIIIRGLNVGKEFELVGRESNIGRWDADNGVFPDIDLDRYDPEAKISRRHARIILDDGQYLVEDLGSTNGTFINRGRRLIPGSRHPLHAGDELILGKTFLKFVIEN